MIRFAALAALGAAVAFGTIAAAQSDGEDPVPPAEFTEEFLADEANIAAGRAVWEGQCRACHGRAAYPGKAPKLRPRRYTADFIYDRASNGFRRMPAWRDVFTDLERMQVAAYILSRRFSP